MVPELPPRTRPVDPVPVRGSAWPGVVLKLGLFAGGVVLLVLGRSDPGLTATGASVSTGVLAWVTRGRLEKRGE